LGNLFILPQTPLHSIKNSVHYRSIQETTLQRIQVDHYKESTCGRKWLQILKITPLYYGTSGR